MEQWEADQNGNQLNHYNMIFRPLLLTVAYRFSGHVHVEVGAVQGIACLLYTSDAADEL